MPAAGTRSGLGAGNRERAVKQQGRFKPVEQLALLFTSLCSELLLKLKDGLVEEVVCPRFRFPYTYCCSHAEVPSLFVPITNLQIGKMGVMKKTRLAHVFHGVQKRITPCTALGTGSSWAPRSHERHRRLQAARLILAPC